MSDPDSQANLPLSGEEKPAKPARKAAVQRRGRPRKAKPADDGSTAPAEGTAASAPAAGASPAPAPAAETKPKPAAKRDDGGRDRPDSPAAADRSRSSADGDKGAVDGDRAVSGNRSEGNGNSRDGNRSEDHQRDHQRSEDHRGDDQRSEDHRGDRNHQGGGRFQGKKNKFRGKQGHGPKDRKFKKFRKKRGGGFASSTDFGSEPEVDELLEWEVLQDEAALLERSSGMDATRPLNFDELYALSIPELEEQARAVEIRVRPGPRRRVLLEDLLRKASADARAVEVSGVLEVCDEGHGFLVFERDNYRICELSALVPEVWINKFGLQRGHMVKARIHAPREGETTPIALEILEVMGGAPEKVLEIVPFTELTPYYPTRRMLLEVGPDVKWDNISMRCVDLLTPVGLGQRGLIVAPPRTGKTVLMQGIANAVVKNNPGAHLIILLVDERPEEVTDFRRNVPAEVISSTFDEAAESHVHAAEMVIEKARRMVEVGRDVVILLDSITRLARAYNTMMPNSGKILSGGVEANALQKPKRFFGSARNIEEGGSLTILGTALVDTGSRMDEVIFEEFKGTGNMELHLDRALVDKRIFPALSFEKSGTRKEELLYHPDEMNKIYSLRRAMKGVPSVEAMEMLIQRVKKTKSNAEFLMSMSR